MKTLICSFILCYPIFCFGQNTDSQFKWPESYKAAVCLTYDDGLDCHLDIAVPALNSFNLKGTFYCTGYSTSLHNRIDDWRSITKSGHELGNHSLFHPCNGARFDWVKPEYDLRTYTLDRIKDELQTANSLLTAIDGKQERTYAYTCSDYKVNQQSYIDTVRTLFTAARNDGPIPESIEHMDHYFVPSWGVIDPTGSELIEYVKQAEERGTIAVFMFHSVGGGYLNVSVEAHNQLLTYLKSRENEIWTDTFLNVMKYVKKKRK